MRRAVVTRSAVLVLIPALAFADLADTLSLTPGRGATLAIAGPFAAAVGANADNLVFKAVAALREKIPGLKAGHFKLEKHIPVAGGVGGGSADAAAALRLLARANGIALDDARLASAALAVGADVPVCVDCVARIMRGVGELLSPPVSLPRLQAVLVNPRVPLSTRDVFAKFSGTQGSKKQVTAVPARHDALIDFLRGHENDLTAAAIACAPVIAEVLIALRTLPAVRLTRMSGSGPTCFALFASAGEAAAAARRLAAERKDWWVQAAGIG